ncbi:MAG: O-antigen ligase family protein [Acidobacteriaceae bacterium]
MTITVLGWIILPLSAVMIILKPEWVYAMAIFFLPFSASAVVNVGSGDSGSGVQVWLYLAILLLLRWAVVGLFRFEIRIKHELRRPILYLFSFVAACALSLLMPLWINGRLQIMSPLLTDFSTTPLVFSSKNITGLLYILIGFAFTVLIANKNTRPEEFRRSSALYLASCAFAAIWGLFQFALNLFDLPYPAMVFNNSITPSAGGYKETMGALGLSRLSSVAVEPSLLVQTLLIGLVFTLPAVLGTGYVFGRYKDRIIAFLLVVVCLASTSSTGYLGLVLLFGIACWALYRSGRLRAGLIVLAGCGALALVGAYFAFGIVREVIGSGLLNKSGSYSALERAKTIYYAFQYFLDYPVLGVGWASVTSHDVVVLILSNTGIVGFTAFCAFFGVMFSGLFQTSRTILSKCYFDQAPLVLSIACAEMLILATITGFPGVFGHFWFILGMGIAASLQVLNHEPIFARRIA